MPVMLAKGATMLNVICKLGTFIILITPSEAEKGEPG